MSRAIHFQPQLNFVHMMSIIRSTEMNSQYADVDVRTSLCCNLWMENTEGIKGREQSITRVRLIIIIKAPVGPRAPATLAFKCPLDPTHMAAS